MSLNRDFNYYEKEMISYAEELRDLVDNIESLISDAWDDAYIIGHEEGLKDGHDKGYAEGWDEGFESGVDEGEKHDTA